MRERGKGKRGKYQHGWPTDGATICFEDARRNDALSVAKLTSKWGPVIGTSASSPDFVGLLALSAEIVKGKLGPVNAELYAAANKDKGYYFRKGLKGNNGYATTSGLWDPVLGLGTRTASASPGRRRSLVSRRRPRIHRGDKFRQWWEPEIGVPTI